MEVAFTDGTIEEYDDEPLEEGAQGAIYLSQDRKHVVKLYHIDKTKDNEYIRRIDALINRFNIAADKYWWQYFTWPEKRVEKPRSGFRMRFVDNMKTLDHYIFPRFSQRLAPEERGWFAGRIATAIKLVSVANRLVKLGLCYPDFSHKNIMVDPFNGTMVMIDCDSLVEPSYLPALVEGTRWYRAPEIVSRKVLIPTTETDRHALAVLLYLWLLERHPLFGDRLPLDADSMKDEELTLGEMALYIENPYDISNRAKEQKVTSAMLGSDLELAFRKTFVDGLHQPQNRTHADEWQEALLRTFDRIIPCTSPTCDWHSFVALPQQGLQCPRCHSPLKNPTTLPFMALLPHRRTGDPNDYPTSMADIEQAHCVVGWHQRYLYCWHTQMDITPMNTHSLDTTPLAMFEYDYTSGWYLKNLAMVNMAFSLRPPTDKMCKWSTVTINSSLPLKSDLWIKFGNTPRYFLASIKIEKVG